MKEYYIDAVYDYEKHLQTERVGRTFIEPQMLNGSLCCIYTGEHIGKSLYTSQVRCIYELTGNHIGDCIYPERNVKFIDANEDFLVATLNSIYIMRRCKE